MEHAGLPMFGAEKHLYGCIRHYGCTCHIGDFREAIFCLQTTQDLPKKHHEVQDCLNKLEQLRTDHDALSQSDYWHTRHCEDWKEVSLYQLKTPRDFWKI